MICMIIQRLTPITTTESTFNNFMFFFCKTVKDQFIIINYYKKSMIKFDKWITMKLYQWLND